MSNISDLLLKDSKCAKVLKKVTTIGHKLDTSVYLVGGSVRDVLLGKEIKDIDLMVENKSSVFSDLLAKKLNVKTVIKYESFDCG